MKKIIIIIVASLIVVGISAFFIVHAVMTATTIKVTSVEFRHSGEVQIENQDGTTSMVKRLSEGTKTYQLTWTVYPYDESTGESTATNQEVTFSSDNQAVTVNKAGLVTFPDTSSSSIYVTITVTTADGDKTDSIILYVYYPGGSIIG